MSITLTIEGIGGYLFSAFEVKQQKISLKRPLEQNPKTINKDEHLDESAVSIVFKAHLNM